MAGAEGVAGVEGLPGSGLAAEAEQALEGVFVFKNLKKRAGLFERVGVSGEVNPEAVQGLVLFFWR